MYMMTTRKLGEEEIRAAYREGEEAVVALFIQTFSMIVMYLQPESRSWKTDWPRTAEIVANRHRVMDTPNLHRRVCVSATAGKAAGSQVMQALL